MEIQTKNNLFAVNEPLYNAIYNPKAIESSETIEDEFEQGFDDPNEIESYLQSMQGELSIAESKLVGNGEWR